MCGGGWRWMSKNRRVRTDFCFVSPKQWQIYVHDRRCRVIPNFSIFFSADSVFSWRAIRHDMVPQNRSVLYISPVCFYNPLMFEIPNFFECDSQHTCAEWLHNFQLKSPRIIGIQNKVGFVSVWRYHFYVIYNSDIQVKGMIVTYTMNDDFCICRHACKIFINFFSFFNLHAACNVCRNLTRKLSGYHAESVKDHGSHFMGLILGDASDAFIG